jgi:hypothetical protein
MVSAKYFVINQVTTVREAQMRKKVTWYACSKQHNNLQISGKCSKSRFTLDSKGTHKR